MSSSRLQLDQEPKCYFCPAGQNLTLTFTTRALQRMFAGSDSIASRPGVGVQVDICLILHPGGVWNDAVVAALITSKQELAKCGAGEVPDSVKGKGKPLFGGNCNLVMSGREVY